MWERWMYCHVVVAITGCSKHKALENLIKAQIVCGMAGIASLHQTNFSNLIGWAYERRIKKNTAHSHANICIWMKNVFYKRIQYRPHPYYSALRCVILTFLKPIMRDFFCTSVLSSKMSLSIPTPCILFGGMRLKLHAMKQNCVSSSALPVCCYSDRCLSMVTWYPREFRLKTWCSEIKR